MIRPANRLLLLAGTAAVLAGVLAGVLAAAQPALLGLALVLYALPVAIAVLDAQRASARAVGLAARLVDGQRQTKDVAATVVVEVQPGTAAGLSARAGLRFPSSMECQTPIANLRLSESDRTTLISWEITPRVRGKHLVSTLYLEIPSPLGLWLFHVALPLDATFRVFPNLLRERRHAAALFLNRARLGSHVVRQVGKGRDFEQLREYIKGDSYEDIHWKATARRNWQKKKKKQVVCIL